MKRILVVIEATPEGRELLSYAGEIAAGIGAELVLLRPIDQSEYDGDLQRKGQTTMEGPDSIDDIETQAEETAAELGEELLDDNVQFQAVGLVDDLPDALLSEAADRNCDHIFITGKKRSPTGKVLFGDDTQSVLLNFDGPVTTLIK